MENPVLLWRNRAGISQKELSNLLGLSRTQVSRIEQGVYAELPAYVTHVTGINDLTYQRYRQAKRQALRLGDFPAISEFITPSDFIEWRQMIAWKKFLKPGTSSFSYALALNPLYLSRFESQESPALFHQLPPVALEALREAGAKFKEAETLDFTFEERTA